MIDDIPIVGNNDYVRYMGATKLAIGERFGRWTLLDMPAIQSELWNQKATARCDCGIEKPVLTKALAYGQSTQCVDCARQTRIKTHGFGSHRARRARLYRIWMLMRQRCRPNNQETRSRYYDRGITVCEEWLHDFMIFREWALSAGYADDLTLDRRDNDQGYSPDNCRWATPTQQGRNKRNNRLLTALGMTQPISAWADDPRCRVSVGALYLRIRAGWEHEKAITTPSTRRQLVRAS